MMRSGVQFSLAAPVSVKSFNVLRSFEGLSVKTNRDWSTDRNLYVYDND